MPVGAVELSQSWRVPSSDNFLVNSYSDQNSSQVMKVQRAE